MINNNICEMCQHYNVCSKLNTLAKFDDDNKKFIHMDITIENCEDYKKKEN